MITLTTAKGAQLRLFIRTETQSPGDHNFMAPCWDLVVAIGDNAPVVAEVTEHAVHGLCIKGSLGSKPFLAPVPEAYRAAVRALATEYKTEVERRLNAALAADQKYEAHRETMRRVLGSACVEAE